MMDIRNCAASLSGMLPTAGAVREEGVFSMIGKKLGVDYGDVRTGLAVSDPSGLIATGVGTVKPGGMRNTARAVAAADKPKKVFPFCSFPGNFLKTGCLLGKDKNRAFATITNDTNT